MMAVLRGQRARLDLELLQRVGKRQRQVQVIVGIVVRAPVQQVGDAVGYPASDGNGDGGIVAHAVERARALRRVDVRTAGGEAGEEDQLCELAPVERELEHLLV